MERTVQDACEVFSARLAAAVALREDLDIYLAFQALTLDVIAEVR